MCSYLTLQTNLNPFERGEIGPDLFRAACDRRL
jgi:hypothetical protein